VAWLVVLIELAVLQPAGAGVVTFDNYTSPTNNDLANNFNQTGTIAPNPYVQSPTDGITGGAVIGYSGSEYRATAVYAPQSFNLSNAGASVSLSIDLFYNAQFQPLAPGANGVRSFNLGVLDAKTSAFETYGNASAYVNGVYALDTNQMLIVGRNTTTSVQTIMTLATASLVLNHWYQIDAAFTNEGSNQIQYTGSLLDLGTTGTSAATSMATWNWSFENDPIATSNSAYAGFSALADGGIALADNFTIPSDVPEPSTWAMMILGFCGLGFMVYRQKHCPRANAVALG
jgi:hypothetical protein